MNLNHIVLLETTAATKSLGERMQVALLNTVMSILIVFSVLILISLIISCFKFINKAQMKAEKKRKAAAASPVETAVSQNAEIEETVYEDDTELVAVITAAIHAYEEANGNQVPADGLVVRSIRRVNKSRWQNA